MDCVLAAVDVGTSALKAALFTLDGTLLGSATQAYPTAYPKAGYAEQDPEAWWRAACQALQDCLRRTGVRPGQIAAVGVDGQSWSAVAMDQDGNPLLPTPIWMDTRAAQLCAQIRNCELNKALFDVSGNPFQPAYTTPKILWLQQNRPDVYQRTVQFLQSNSFIVHRLTGVYSQDYSQGYGLHVFDIRKLAYDVQLCRALGLDADKLPPLYPSHAVVGGVTPAAARQTGLLAGTPVVAGGLDAACGTLGAGVLEEGQTQEQGGQAGGMSVCLTKPIAHEALILGAHVAPGRWLLQGGTVGGGGSLRWLARELGQPEQRRAQETGESVYALLDRLAGAVPPGAQGMVFLPYLAGERSPLWDADATGVFFGLSYEKTRAHFFRALLESAAYALQHNLLTAREAGVEVRELYAMGGAANSLLWTQIKADVTGCTLHVPQSDAATTWGAAMVAGVGVGAYPDFATAARSIRIQRTHTPDPALAPVYARNYDIYRELYIRLAPLMHRARA